MTPTVDAAPDLAALLAKWAPFIRCVVRRYAPLGLDADDVRGDVVLALVRDFHKFDPARATFGTWVGLVARRVCQSAAERWARAARVGGSSTPPPGACDDPDEPLYGVAVARDPHALDPHAVAVRSECRAAVGAALADAPLTPAQRAALAARFWDGGTLNRTEHGHLNAALAVLRACMTDPEMGEDDE